MMAPAVQVLAVLVVGAPVVAGTEPVVPVLQNTHLRDQLEADPERRFVDHDRVVGGADVRTFTRGATSGDPGVYHSGMMADVFLELDPIETMRANLRMSWIHPSFSSGIVSPAGLVIWPALTGDVIGDDDTLTLRGGDFGPYQVGNGLVIQDETGLGAMLQWRHHDFRMRAEWAGTGLVAMYGDWRSIRADHNDDTVGLYVATIGHGVQGIQDGMVGLHAAPRLTPWLRPMVEGVWWLDQWAGLAALEVRKADPSGWQGMLKLQGRHYPEGFGGEHFSLVSHDYVAIDQEAHDFIRADNLLVLGDGVSLLGGRGVLRLHPWRRTFLRFDVEVLRTWWPGPELRVSTETVTMDGGGSYYVDRFDQIEAWGRYAPDWIPFYRMDVGVCLRDSDNHCILGNVNNRASSGMVLPWLTDLEPKTLIEQNLTLGAELFVRF